MTIAKIGNMRDQIGMKTPREFALCTRCHSQFSANKGDYWNKPDDYTLTCCDAELVLVTMEKRYIPYTQKEPICYVEGQEDNRL